jgi:hypothetical protein
MLRRDGRHASELQMPAGHDLAACGTWEGSLLAAGAAESGLSTGHVARQHGLLQSQVERSDTTPDARATKTRAMPSGARSAQRQIAIHF